MVSLFLLMLTGYLANRSGVIDKTFESKVSRFIVNISLPATILNAVTGSDMAHDQEMLPIFVAAVSIFLVAHVICHFIQKTIRWNPTYELMLNYSNLGFMGIPIIIALYPEQGGIYIAVFTVIDQLVLWTIGLDLTSPPDSQTSVSLSKRLIKMVNPATIAITTGVFLVLTGIKLPAAVVNALAKPGSAASPLAMIYLGGIFCYIKIQNYLKCREIYATVLIKMVLLPIAFYTVMHHIPSIDHSIAVTLSVLCALPSMASIAMIAETQHSDGDYAAGMIFITTLFSIVTLPLVCLSL